MPKKTKKTKLEKMGSIQSDFVNLASHQLRTPLSGMRWLLELIRKPNLGTLNKKQREYIDKIYNSNERMIAIVNDLLEVTRLEQGNIKPYIQPTDLAVIVSDIVREKKKEIKDKDMKVSLTIEEEPFPNVKTEPNMIKHAISNLISNAITYTKSGGNIKIELKRLDNSAVFKVSDTGVGIPKAEQSKIFDKFFRGSNVLKFENSGTGLGLFLTKAFVEASGGKLWFKSEEGKGSTFYFTLPIINK